MNDTVRRLVLLVNDMPAEQRAITSHAAKAGWQVIHAHDSEGAITALGTQQGMRLDAIIVDQNVMADMVCELIAQLKSRRAALPILMLTQSTSPLLAVEAMRAGATDYLIKPVTPERLVAALDAAITRADTTDELQPLTEKIAAPLEFDAIIGSSPPFRAALAIAAKSARSQVPILIEGENGTGKEMIARAVHAASPRAKTPLRMINCTGSTDMQLASQIFGHEQGAFTGAFEQHMGLIQRAGGGTLLIDEIDQMPLETQARLIDFMHTKEIWPLGAKHSFQADIRILASSNRPLPMLVESGEFREDLFYALSIVHLEIPALRARQGDIPALTRHFLARIAEQPGMRGLGITDDAVQLLCAYDWPGNVRQLQNTLFRAAIFCDGDALTTHEFPQLSNMLGEVDAHRHISQEGIGVALYSEDGNLRPLEEIEADVIRLAIGHYSGRMTEVARRLGIGRSTLYRKLSDLGIDSAA